MRQDGETSSLPVLAGSAVAGSAIAGALLWLIYIRTPYAPAGLDLAWLPGFNAACNAMSAACLVAGYAAVRRNLVGLHMRFMLAALLFSTLFLCGYVTHHAVHGDTKFLGTGVVRPVYFTVLVSHIGLSVVALPLILSALWFALGGRFAAHRRVARFALPVWLYVSVTGVAVYAFLRFFDA